MAFYIQHQTAKEKVQGFAPNQPSNNNNPPSPTSTFDPSSLFFNGSMFPDPFRQPSGSNSAIDFTDTLLSLMPNDHQGQQQGQQQSQGQQPQQSQQPPPQPHALNLNIPHNVFDMSHFPSHLNSFQGPRDEQLDSPASLQTTHSFFNDPHAHYNAASSIPSYINHRPDTPATSVGGGIGSPSHARMHSHRSPSVGPGGVSASRSRSRSRTSKPPPASRNPVGRSKRQSISSTPEEVNMGAPSPPPRPQAILIPSQQLSPLGPPPITPLGMHSTQTAPSAWFVPQTNPNGLASAVEGSFNIPQNGDHTNRFNPGFVGSATRSLSLGTSPKPGTSASASVLAGSLGAGKNPMDGSMDAVQKQYVRFILFMCYLPLTWLP